MADYDAVTVEQFLERFPRFASQDEDFIGLLLAEAALQVDDSWLAPDYPNAILYLTAHLLIGEIAAGSGNDAGTSGIIQSESFGPMSRTYAINAASITEEGLEGSVYGRRYRSLRRKNFPGIAYTT